LRIAGSLTIAARDAFHVPDGRVRVIDFAHDRAAKLPPRTNGRNGDEHQNYDVFDRGEAAFIAQECVC